MGEKEYGRVSNLDVAKAIAGRYDKIRIGRLGTDNSFDQEVPWPKEEPSVPWAVYLRDRTGESLRCLPFDFDSKLGPSDEHARQFTQMLEKLDIPHLHAGSGPTGGHHGFLLLAEPLSGDRPKEVGMLVAQRFPSLDLTPLARTWIAASRPPGSPHRGGGHSELVSDEEAVRRALSCPVTREQLARLVEELGASRAESEWIVSPPALVTGIRERVTERTWAILTSGTCDGRDRSKSSVINKALIGLCSKGFSRDEAWAVMLDPTLEISRIVKARADEQRRSIADILSAGWGAVLSAV